MYIKFLVSIIISFLLIGCAVPEKQIVASDIPQQKIYNTYKKVENKPSDLQDLYVSYYLDHEKNEVLNLMHLGLYAFQKKYYTEAEQVFDNVLLNIESIYGEDKYSENAKSLWYGEDAKRFIGEPYERALAYYYRGLLYLKNKDYENARASFKGGWLQDARSQAEQYQSDFNIFLILEALSSRLNGDENLFQSSLEEMKLYEKFTGDIDLTGNSTYVPTLISNSNSSETSTDSVQKTIILDGTDCKNKGGQTSWDFNSDEGICELNNKLIRYSPSKKQVSNKVNSSSVVITDKYDCVNKGGESSWDFSDDVAVCKINGDLVHYTIKNIEDHSEKTSGDTDVKQEDKAISFIVYKITASTVNIYKDKSKKSSVEGTLYKNNLIKSNQIIDSWVKIETGWIQKEDLEVFNFASYDKYLKTGQTKSEIISNWGEPFEISSDSTFKYIDGSMIHFNSNDKVAGWTNYGLMKDSYSKNDDTSIANKCKKLNGMYTDDKCVISGNTYTSLELNELLALEQSSVNKKYVITAKTLSIRSEPSLKGQKVGSYKLNDQIIVKSITNEWLQTDKGWVYSKFTKPYVANSNVVTKKVDSKSSPEISLQKSKVYEVKTNTINVRQKANTKSKIVAKLERNDLVQSLAETDDWVQTKDGWIFKNLLTEKKLQENEIFDNGKIVERFTYNNLIDGLKNANLFLIVDTGNAPEKYTGGRNDSELMFRSGSYFSTPTVRINDYETKTQMIDDIYFQATTRGGREIDKIIEGKVAWKDEAYKNSENFTKTSKVSWEVSKNIMNNYQSTGNNKVDGVVGGVALIFAALAATTAVAAEISEKAAESVITKADARHWYNIPGGIYLYMDKLQPGHYTLKVNGVNEQELIVNIPNDGILVEHVFDQRIDKPSSLVSSYELKRVIENEDQYLEKYTQQLEKEKSNESVKNLFSDFFGSSKPKL